MKTEQFRSELAQQTERVQHELANMVNLCFNIGPADGFDSHGDFVHAEQIQSVREQIQSVQAKMTAMAEQKKEWTTVPTPSETAQG